MKNAPRNEELVAPLVRSILFSEKDYMILQVSELLVVAFTKFAKESEKTIVVIMGVRRNFAGEGNDNILLIFLRLMKMQ